MTDSVQTGWKIHDTIVSWTNSVDNKASFVSTLETAVLIGAVALTGDHRRLSHLEYWLSQLFFWAGIGLLVAALALALHVVRPRLRARAVKREAHNHFIFFGHIHFQTTAQVEQQIRNAADPLPAIASQLKAMSDIAWAKYRELQLSVVLLALGSALLGFAAATK